MVAGIGAVEGIRGPKDWNTGISNFYMEWGAKKQDKTTCVV